MFKQLLAGGLFGVLAAIGLVFGIPGMVVALIAVVLVGFIPRLPALVAGGLIGVGATWFVLFARVAVLCAEPQQQCGGTPIGIGPWLAFAGGVVVVGVLVGAYAFRTSRREARGR